MLITVGSWRGSPGATTAALALAEAWPTGKSVYVAECDQRGGSLAARFLVPGPRRLTELAGQSRRGGEPSLLNQHATSAPGGVRVLTGPEDGRLLRAALQALLAPGGVFEQTADDPDTVLIADVGRVDTGVPEIASLLLLADMLVLTARPVPEQILTLAGTSQQARSPHPDTELLLIGPGYPAEHVAELLRMPVLGQLPLIPAGAAAIRERVARRDPFRTAAAQVCRMIIARLAESVPAQRTASDDRNVAQVPGDVVL